MGLFDFLKKKTAAVQVDSELEALLQKAATEPAYRAEFYNRLLNDNLVILTGKSDVEFFAGVLEKDTTVDIVSFSDGKIPVFTSTQRIFDGKVIKEQVSYMEMQGRALFELAPGATFLLNPYSSYGKELLPAEVESMLGGTLLESKKIVVEKDTEVQIGQPSNYPDKAINSLKILFAGKAEVDAAYLAWIYDAASQQPPHYIVGIEGDADLQQVIREAGMIFEQYLGPDEIVDFIKVEEGKSLSDYFYSIQPFYTKSGK